METENVEQKIYQLKKERSGFTISSITGLSIGVVTFLFGFTLVAIKLAGIHFLELIQGELHFHGEPSLLYMAIFLISATMLLVVQHHFSDYKEED